MCVRLIVLLGIICSSQALVDKEMSMSKAEHMDKQVPVEQAGERKAEHGPFCTGCKHFRFVQRSLLVYFPTRKVPYLDRVHEEEIAYCPWCIYKWWTQCPMCGVHELDKCGGGALLQTCVGCKQPYRDCTCKKMAATK